MPFGFNFNPLNLFNNSNNEKAKARTPRTTRKPRTTMNVITLEEGLQTLQEGIMKLFNILEGSEPNFTSEEHIMLYTTVFNLCSPISIPGYERELYNLYEESCEHYITSKVLSSLQGKQDEHLLRELHERWLGYKIMTKRLTGVFSGLDRSGTLHLRFGLPNLEETSFSSFYNLVYEQNQEIMPGQRTLIFNFFRSLQR